MQELITLILADDSKTGAESSGAKTVYKICGAPLISYVIDAAFQAGSKSVYVFLDQNSEQIKEFIPNDIPCMFKQQCDIRQALMKIIEVYKEGTILILNEDIPVITGETLKDAYQYHKKQCNHITILADNSTNHLSSEQVVPVIYFFEIETLLSIFSQQNCENYNMADIIDAAVNSGKKLGSYKAADLSEIMRVDDSITLNNAEHIIQKRIIMKHMENGVVFHLPETCIIHKGVKIGKDTVINPGTLLEGGTVIGTNCEIGPYSRIEDGYVGNNVRFMNSVMLQSQIGDNTTVGPFAYIRPGSKIGQNIKIGDFVEIKNSTIGDNTKVPHLTYVGDADVGKGVNFGCGSIVVNYDGKKKHRTTVGDHAFIGCNVNLVSPVVINDYAYIAAGSTITEEVPSYALAIARNRQTIKENWVKKKELDKK